MTEHTTEGGGTPLSSKKVEDPAHFERAPAPRQPVREAGDPNLAFEAAPRAPIVPTTTPDPRTLRTSPPPPQPTGPSPDATADPVAGTRPPTFEAVPASVAVAQGRLSTPTIGVRPAPAPSTAPVSPGGSGWNVRPREGGFLPNRGGADTGEGSSWQTRPLPGADRDRSNWGVPEAPPKRTLTDKTFLRIVLAVILVAILGFAGYEWFTGRAHPDHTITTPAAVGSLTAIHTAATAAVTQQMQTVMQQDGATQVVTGVYGQAGKPKLVVLLAQGPNIESSSSRFFSDFSTGLKTQGLTVLTAKTLNTTTDGSDFICSPATGAAPLTAVSLCGWDDGDTIGLVLDVTSSTVSTTLREAESARSAGEH